MWFWTKGRRAPVAAAVALTTAASGMAVALSVAPPAAARDLDWPAAVTVTEQEVTTSTDLVLAPDGTATAVWSSGVGASATVYAADRRPSGSWSAPVALGKGSWPSAGVADDGEVLAVWASDAGVVAAARPGGGSWSPSAVIGTGAGALPELAVAADGSAAVVWYGDVGGSGAIFGVGRSRTGTWGARSTLDQGVVSGGDVAISAAGVATAVWQQRGSAPYTGILRTATWDGSWSGATDVTSYDGYAEPIVAVGRSGVAAVVLHRESAGGRADSGNAVTAAVRSGGSWRSTVVQPIIPPADGAVTYSSPAVAVSDTGEATVGWSRHSWGGPTSYELWTSTGGGAFTASHRETQSGGEFAWSSLAYDSDGDLHAVVTRTSSGPQHLVRLTRTASGEWSDLTALAPGTDGLRPQLRISSGDAAAVLFRGGDGALRATVAEPGGVVVSVGVFDKDGRPLDGEIAPGQYVQVQVVVDNRSDEDLEDVSFRPTVQGTAYDATLIVDPRSPGGLEVVAEPADVPTTVPAGERVVLDHELTTLEPGLAAAHTMLSAETESGDEVEFEQSLRFDIEDGEVVDEALGRIILLEVIDQYLMQAYRDFADAMRARGVQLKKQLLGSLAPASVRAWFGDDGVSPTEQAQAEFQGVDAALVDARLPDRKFRGHTVDELNAEYNEAFYEKAKDGAADYVQNWKNLGKKAKSTASAAWAEAGMAAWYMVGQATPEERRMFEAKMVQFADLNSTSARNLINTVKREIPRYRENGVYFSEALGMAVDDALLQSPDLQAQLATEKRARANLIKLADTDPVAFQRKWAERDAEIFNLGMPLIFDTLIGGVTTRLGGAAKTALKGSGVVNAGEAMGALRNGKQAAGTKTLVPPVADGSAVTGAASRTTEEFLSSLDDATIVQASDLGDVYSLPNVGGVPEITLDVKAAILGDLEAEYLSSTGRSIELAEVLKPSSELRKPGGVAKLELTEQKTGKPAMLDGGAPTEVLAEASVWRNTQHPSKQAGWSQLSNARQQAAIKEWTSANDRWAAWQDPAPGSKTARLQQCIGQRCEVPLDTEPLAGGLQRFVKAEYEVVDVKRGTAEAKLIRVKHYEVIVKDTLRDNLVVNSKTVVDDAARALPQTPDADAVAVAKVVGRDAAGQPILEPLSRAEREFVMQRYIDKNIKARRSGALPDAAEHGATLIMDDASAAAAGKLLPSYGVPFLPEGAGTAYLERIAQWVAPKGVSREEMLEKMLRYVQSEGGFGQHAVVVTRDSRYLGEVAVSQW